MLYALNFLLYFYVLWLLYVLVMAFYRPYLLGQLKPPVLYLAAPVLVVGIVLDVVGNILASVIFLSPPFEWMLTTRLTRYISNPLESSWRKRWAGIICHQLLDMFDPRGQHCI